MLTLTEQRMLVVLADGLRHTRAELKACLWDELALDKVVSVHICNLRKKLPRGEDILCVLRFRRTYYQHVRLLTPERNMMDICNHGHGCKPCWDEITAFAGDDPSPTDESHEQYGISLLERSLRFLSISAELANFMRRYHR